MAEQATVTSSDVVALSGGLLACDHLRLLAGTRELFQEHLAWMLSDPSGNLSTDFKGAITAQLLYDAAKLGWFVRSNPSTGRLELVEKIPLAGITSTGAALGDYFVFNGTTWDKHTPFYGAPTSGGTTLPDPDVGGILSAGHSLNQTPKQIECFIECATADANYSVGDRINASGLIQRGGGGEDRPAIAVGASSTLVWAVFNREGTVGRTWRLPDKNTPWDIVNLTPANWNVRLYASY